MLWLTEDAVLRCDHGGGVANRPSQALVHVGGRRVLVRDDPEGRSIGRCPNTNPFIGLLPCRTTLVAATGYSALVRIAGRPVVLDSLKGLTDGSPPGTVTYQAVQPGQALVSAGA